MVKLKRFQNPQQDPYNRLRKAELRCRCENSIHEQALSGEVGWQWFHVRQMKNKRERSERYTSTARPTNFIAQKDVRVVMNKKS